MEDWNMWRLVWEITVTVLSLAAAGGAYLANARRVSAAGLRDVETALRERLALIEANLAVLQARQEAALSHQDLEKLHQRLTGMGRELNQLVGQVNQLLPTHMLMQQYLMNQGAKS